MAEGAVPGSDDPILLVLAVGALVTYLWRAVGVALSDRMAPTGAVIEWVSCVAYALLAALVARMIVLPIGGLGQVPLWIRLVALAAAFAPFVLLRRNVALGVVTGVLVLAVLATRFS